MMLFRKDKPLIYSAIFLTYVKRSISAISAVNLFTKTNNNPLILSRIKSCHLFIYGTPVVAKYERFCEG
jgi:hypothetical protein